MNKRILLFALLALLLTSSSATRFLQEDNGDQVDTQAEVQVDDQVDEQVDNQGEVVVEDQVDEQVDEPVDEQVDEPVDEQVDEQPDNENGDDINDDSNQNQNITEPDNQNQNITEPIQRDNRTDNLTEAIKLYYLPDFIRVTGKAWRQLKNDLAVIKLTVETLELLGSNSLSLNAQKMNSTVTELMNLGLNETEFSTSDFTVQPSYQSVYSQENNTYRNVFEGIKVRNSLTIRSDKIDLVGQIIDAAINNGVNNIENVDFQPSDSNISQLRKDLLEEAIANGKEQAQEIVDHIGYRVRSVKSINVIDSPSNPPVFFNRAESFAADSAPISTPVFSSTDKVELNVEMTFIIEEIEA